MRARARTHVMVACVATIALGLASRRFPALVPRMLGQYPGDALWAQMVYWLVAFVTPRASITRLALCALVISYADELSQLYQAAWINSIRSTTVGHLVLGSRFSWMDMLAYTVGVAVVVVTDWRMHRQN